MYAEQNGGGEEPEFDWRAYAGLLKSSLDQKIGEAWTLEQENLRLRAGRSDVEHFLHWLAHRSLKRRIVSNEELRFRARKLLEAMDVEHFDEAACKIPPAT